MNHVGTIAHYRPGRAFAMFAAVLGLAACNAALSAELPLSQSSADAAALQSIAATNDRTARALELGTCASERSAVTAAASGCTDTVCRVSIAAIAALTPCAAQRIGSIAQAQATPAPQIIQTQREITVGERIVGLFAGGVSKIFDTAIALGPSYLNYKLGTVQSNNQTALGIVNSNNALGATQSTNGAFTGFGNNLQGTANSGFLALGNMGYASTAALRDTSVAGFGALRDLGNKPTTVVTGDGNNLITGTGNTTQSGTNNRINSAGPCTAGDGGNQTGTAAPGTTTTTTGTTTTTTPTTTGAGGTGGSSDCQK